MISFPNGINFLIFYLSFLFTVQVSQLDTRVSPSYVFSSTPPHMISKYPGYLLSLFPFHHCIPWLTCFNFDSYLFLLPREDFNNLVISCLALWSVIIGILPPDFPKFPFPTNRNHSLLKGRWHCLYHKAVFSAVRSMEPWVHYERRDKEVQGKFLQINHAEQHVKQSEVLKKNPMLQPNPLFLYFIWP